MQHIFSLGESSIHILLLKSFAVECGLPLSWKGHLCMTTYFNRYVPFRNYSAFTNVQVTQAMGHTIKDAFKVFDGKKLDGPLPTLHEKIWHPLLHNNKSSELIRLQQTFSTLHLSISNELSLREFGNFSRSMDALDRVLTCMPYLAVFCWNIPESTRQP